MTLREQFFLDPDVVFLNHGSFGACPRPVLEEYQRWQRELERQPVEFLGRRWDGLLTEARAALAVHVGARTEDLVFVPNATTAMNTVARSLRLGPEDEVLTSEDEYGAVDFAWEETGARVVRRPLAWARRPWSPWNPPLVERFSSVEHGPGGGWHVTMGGTDGR